MNENSETWQTTEEARWRSRPVRYRCGHWTAIAEHIPRFDLRPFVSVPEVGAPRTLFQPELGEMANPFLQVVTRRPMTSAEAPIPVGVVSRSYRLVQHTDVADLCRTTLIEELGVREDELSYELGLSELGEWMNLRIYFPRRPPYIDDNNELTLRLECFNSVEGSCRLVILFGWLRFVCTNGIIIGETRVDVRERHGSHLDLLPLGDRIRRAFEAVNTDLSRISGWHKTGVALNRIAKWADTHVTQRWNKTAAARVFHICKSGRDISIADPFAPGAATEKPVVLLGRVEGSPERATTVYDVAQALSFVASRRQNAEERPRWQGDISQLLDKLVAGNGTRLPTQESRRALPESRGPPAR